MSYGVAQVLKLEQAKVGDSVIVNYVQSSGVTYDLKADEIVYLKEQGLSDDVLNAMMNQRTSLAGSAQTAAAPSAPASPPTASPSANTSQTATAAAPSVTYIQQQPAQSSTVYVVPTSPTYYYTSPAYYPYYGGSSYPAANLALVRLEELQWQRLSWRLLRWLARWRLPPLRAIKQIPFYTILCDRNGLAVPNSHGNG